MYHFARLCPRALRFALRRCVSPSIAPCRIKSDSFRNPLYSYYLLYYTIPHRLLKRGSTSPRSIILIAGSSHSKRINAHCFLTAGDLLWRIAIAFGPATLYVEALAGPSSTATLYRHCSPPIQGNLVDNLLMPTEVMALLGVTTLHQSFWPPLELFRDSQHFNGEWSPANEEWFDQHVRKIGAGDLSTLTPQKQWKTHFRRHCRAKDLPALAVVGTLDHTQSSQDTLLSSYPDIWDSYDVIDIVRTPSL